MSDYKMTKQAIPYKSFPYGNIATIPARTIVTPADNLPQGGYWVARWPGASDKAIGWGRGYGFHVSPEEVEHAPIAELWGQAEALGWKNPITSQGDDVDPEEVDKAEQEALEFLVKQWEE
jgi:hypothetical protein